MQISARNTKVYKIREMQGYIFRILRHFATKLCNFTNVKMLFLAVVTSDRCIGASVAQWSERSPFTSEAAGSILRENFLNVTRAQCFTHVKRVSQRSAERRGFSPGTPVSSHREVDRVV